jgi:taurine dioxygenase
MESIAGLECRPITPAVGAVIEGVDLRRPLSKAAKGSIHQAMLDHGVVFFRGQDELTLDELARFVSNFAALQTGILVEEGAPPAAAALEFNIAEIKQGTALWHSDFTFYDEPTVYTGLRSVKLPPVGGDTCWASMYAAYDALSEPLRQMLDGLTAVHSMSPTAERLPHIADNYARAAQVYGDQAIHPMVIVHPETGRKALYVFEGATTRVVELSSTESKYLLAMLFDHLRSPQFAMRWTWKPNDVALWDNRALQHFAVPDYAGERIMQSVRTIGQRPVGVSGTV